MKKTQGLPRYKSILFGCVVAMTILVAITLKNWIQNLLKTDLFSSNGELLRDNSALIILMVIIEVLTYYGVLDSVQGYLPIRALTLALLIFIFLWIIAGGYMVSVTRYFIRGWYQYERSFSARERIFREYEDLHLESNLTPSMARELKKKKLALEYFLIRQEFISPTFFPIFGEDFLRDDFNFAAYLEKCMTKTLSQIFGYTHSTVISILLLGLLCLAVSAYGKNDKVSYFSPFQRRM